MNLAYNSCSQVFLSFFNVKRKSISNVGHSSKTLLLQILVIIMIFSGKIGWYTFFLLYLWANYEPIWKQIFTAQTVTLGANLIVKAQTIPPNAKCSFFFTRVQTWQNSYRCIHLYIICQFLSQFMLLILFYT